MSNKGYVNMANARTDEQREAMQRVKRRGFCPLCPRNIHLEHQLPITHEGNYWFVTANKYPYENTRLQLMIIPREHIECLADMPPEAGQELIQILQMLEKKHLIEGGAFGLRFGNPELNGGTIHHLHVQLVVTDVTDKQDPAYKPVRFRMG